MVFPWVFNVFQSAQRHVRVDEVWIALDKSDPLVVPGHGNRTGTKLLDSRVYFVRIAFQDASERIIGFLDFANDNRLQFAPRVLEIEIGL